jgi:hypothetical protein
MIHKILPIKLKIEKKEPHFKTKLIYQFRIIVKYNYFFFYILEKRRYIFLNWFMCVLRLFQ